VSSWAAVTVWRNRDTARLRTTLRSCFDPRKRHAVKAAEVQARIRAQPAELALDAGEGWLASRALAVGLEWSKVPTWQSD
jgi:hypothetical protein